jgi:hypothetical protein
LEVGRVSVNSIPRVDRSSRQPPKGRQDVAWWRQPQGRAKWNHRHAFSVIFSQGTEWGRHRRASKRPFEKQRAIASGVDAVSLPRSSASGDLRASAAHDLGPGAHAARLRLAAAFAARAPESTAHTSRRGRQIHLLSRQPRPFITPLPSPSHRGNLSEYALPCATGKSPATRPVRAYKSKDRTHQHGPVTSTPPRPPHRRAQLSAPAWV